MDLKRYITELFGLNKEPEEIQIPFKDRNLDENSSESILSIENLRSNIFFLVCCIILIYAICLSLYLNNFSNFFTTYCLITSLIIEITLKIVTCLNRQNLNVIEEIKYFRYMCLYISLYLFLGFLDNVDQNKQLEYNLRLFYYFFFILNILYFYYFEFNAVLHVIIAILNTLIILFFQFQNKYTNYFYVDEITANIIFYVVSFFIIKKEYLIKSLNEYKIQKFNEYSKNFINFMNSVFVLIV